MTTTERNIIIAHNKIKALIWRCVLTDNKQERIKYGKQLTEMLNESKQSSYKMSEMFDDMISKLMKAAKTIQEQNEWFECLNTAMGDNREKIIYAASTAQTILEKYKKRRLKRED